MIIDNDKWRMTSSSSQHLKADDGYDEGLQQLLEFILLIFQIANMLEFYCINVSKLLILLH